MYIITEERVSRFIHRRMWKHPRIKKGRTRIDLEESTLMRITAKQASRELRRYACLEERSKYNFYYYIVRKYMYIPTEERVSRFAIIEWKRNELELISRNPPPHANYGENKRPTTRIKKIRVLGGRERWTRHPEVRLEPRINHPNNRAVPPADSPKRSPPTACNSVFCARVQGDRPRFFQPSHLLEKLRRSGKEYDYFLQL